VWALNAVPAFVSFVLIVSSSPTKNRVLGETAPAC